MFSKFEIDDLRDFITPETILVIDADGIAYKPAQIIDETFITVLHKPSGASKEFKNITEFRGRTKEVAEASWLGSHNVDRVARGLKPRSIEEFEITPGIRPRLPLHIATEAVDRHIEAICSHLNISKDNILLLLGGKDNFRLDLPLPYRYKSGRNRDLTPTRLVDVRKYIVENYNVKFTDHIEADDELEIFGFEGYIAYRKTGKFTYIVSSNDKDARSTPSLLFDWSRDADEWKNPKPWLIPSADIDIGTGEFQKGEGKYIGFMNYCYQMLAGDDADTYFPHKHLPRLSKDKQRGHSSFYKMLMGCTSPKELLTEVVNTYYVWFPEGTQFTDWTGKEQKLTTLEWMEIMWQCVYMKRSYNDPTTFTMLLDKYGVEYVKT